MSLLAGIGGLLTGVGIFGAGRAGNQKFRGFGEMTNLYNELGSNREMSYFQRIANQAAPSQSDLMSVAAATGGSNAAATATAQQGQAQAGTQAMDAFSRYRQGIQGLRANLITQKTAMRQADFNARRQAKVDAWSGVASVGSSVLGMGLGQANAQAGQQGVQQASAIGSFAGSMRATTPMPQLTMPKMPGSGMGMYGGNINTPPPIGLNTYGGFNLNGGYSLGNSSRYLGGFNND